MTFNFSKEVTILQICPREEIYFVFFRPYLQNDEYAQGLNILSQRKEESIYRVRRWSFYLPATEKDNTMCFPKMRSKKFQKTKILHI